MYMQPMLMIRSAVPGMVFINGRFAGEAGEDSAVSMPVSSRGTLFLEHRPLQAGYLPLARRIAMSNGRPVGASLKDQEGLWCAIWPGPVVDIELSPERCHESPPRVFANESDGLSVRLMQGEKVKLELSRQDKTVMHELPQGAQPPTIRLLPNGGAQMAGGIEPGGQYLLALDADLEHPQLSMSGRNVELLDDLSVRVLWDARDLVGHARLITYQYADGLHVQGAMETLWADGAPRWPDTPEDTALAALEAAMLGLTDEAHAYFAPGFPAHGNMALAQAREVDGCVKLKYPMPDGRQAVGLVRLIGDNGVEILPVVYHAQPMGGSQGMWRIDRMELVTE